MRAQASARSSKLAHTKPQPRPRTQVKLLNTGNEVVRVALDACGSTAFCGCADGSLAVHALSLAENEAEKGGGGGGGGTGKRLGGPKGLWAGYGSSRGGAGSGGGTSTGSLVAQVAGHSEVLTAVVVLGSATHGVVTVGGDGCILHWHRPPSGASGEAAAAAAAATAWEAAQPAGPAVRERPARGATPPRLHLTAGGGAPAGQAAASPASRAAASPVASVRPGVAPIRDGTRAAAVLGGASPLAARGGRAARCGTVGVAGATGSGLPCEPLQSIDKLPSWAAGGLSPARAAHLPSQLPLDGLEAQGPSLARFTDPPPVGPPLQSPQAKQARQQWQVADARLAGGAVGPAGAAADGSMVPRRVWAEDLEEADDSVLLQSVECGEGGGAGFRVCDRQQSGRSGACARERKRVLCFCCVLG